MTQGDDQANDRSGLKALSSNPDSTDIEHFYDDWAAQYDQNLTDWNYQAPTVAASLLKREVPVDGKILDAGCGTGLSGAALQTAGYQDITGMDLSQDSLDLAAKTGAYRQLSQVNMQELSLPYEPNTFAGLQGVGVLTYVPDTNAIRREFCRVVQPGGLIVFTQRDDLYADRNCEAVFDALEKDQVWTKVSVSEPQPYLPGNEEYSDKINVIYGVFRVS